MNTENETKLATPAACPDTELATENDNLREPQLEDGQRPSGLERNGLVRTTGWLQFGAQPISSGLVTAIICLLVSVALGGVLLPAAPLAAALGMVLPAVGYGLWWLVTHLLLPASTARNTDTVKVAELRAGSWVRLHGSIGPVGQVASTRPARKNALTTTWPGGVITVRFVGGASMSWPREHLVQLAELLG